MKMLDVTATRERNYLLVQNRQHGMEVFQIVTTDKFDKVLTTNTFLSRRGAINFVHRKVWNAAI